MSAASAPTPTASRRSSAPENALILTSATPGKVADDSNGQHSVLMTELLTHLNPQLAGIESAFNKTRIAISRATDGEQVPSVSSSLLEDVSFTATVASDKAGS